MLQICGKLNEWYIEWYNEWYIDSMDTRVAKFKLGSDGILTGFDRKDVQILTCRSMTFTILLAY